MAPIHLILTNDWELYGEGSGDFYVIQRDRLHEMLECVESHAAKVTIFAETGQQFGHLASNQLSLRTIARDWEECLRSTLKRGHDVQLHWHPTWHHAKNDGQHWHLNLKTWSLADIETDEAVAILRRGREYLESFGRSVRPDYRCLAFRAGAFAAQPLERTFSIAARAGLLCDSSIVPGHWDYLYFDYRGESETQPHERGGLLELPIFTEKFWDSPLARRGLASLGFQRLASRLAFNSSLDSVYEEWARARDVKLAELSPVIDPLEAPRQRARFSLRQWPSFVVRRSARVLDYDFMSPSAFVDLVERAGGTDQTAPVTLVALGHMNNAHNMQNLDRTLRLLRERFGSRLRFHTVQSAFEEWANHSREKKPSSWAPLTGEP